ncbi:MAG: aromatic-ring-hydroxylating dioxygenase subunit beta [Alphaproteobacteria bacterium]
MMALTAQDLFLIDELQTRYIHALDSKNMPGWLAAFAETPEASYICITQESVERNLPLALIMDDCYARLQDRVTYITKIWAGTFQDYRTRHFIQRVSAAKLSENTVQLHTNFTVIYTPEDTGSSEVLTAGVYEDVVLLANGSAQFLSKRAVTDTSILPRYLVYPL